MLCCELVKASRVLRQFGVAEPAGGEAQEGLCVHINVLAVHLDHRRRGVAGALLERVLASHPEKAVYVETQSKNDDAKAFYERRSFAKVAECANYYKRCLSKDRTAWLYRRSPSLKRKVHGEEFAECGSASPAKVARTDHGAESARNGIAGSV